VLSFSYATASSLAGEIGLELATLDLFRDRTKHLIGQRAPRGKGLGLQHPLHSFIIALGAIDDKPDAADCRSSTTSGIARAMAIADSTGTRSPLYRVPTFSPNDFAL